MKALLPLVVALATSCHAGTLDVAVASDGSDVAALETLKTPFRTIGAAVAWGTATISSGRDTGAVTELKVTVAPGRYPRFTIPPTAGVRVTVEGPVDESKPAVVSGGVVVPPSLFRKNDALTAAAGGNKDAGTWTLSITSQNCGSFGCGQVTCTGVSTDLFRVETVRTGSAADPNSGACKQWHIPTQNVLLKSTDAGKTYSAAAAAASCQPFQTGLAPGSLNCGNANQSIAGRFFMPAGATTVYTADLKSLGIPLASFGAIVAGDCIHGCTRMPAPLSFGLGAPMVLARWPNLDLTTGRNTYDNAGAACGEGCLSVKNADGAGERVARWATEGTGWIHGYFEWDWADCYRAIVSVNTTAAPNVTQVTFDPADARPKPNARFYGLNLLSELDAPGEFFLDFSGSGQKLHLIPPLSMPGGPGDWATGPTLGLNESVIDISGTTGATVKRLQVMDGRGVGIRAVDVSGATISGCTSSMHGEQGIFMTNAVDSTIADNSVSYTGCAAMRAHGGNATTLAKGNNRVLRNNITRFSLWKRTYQAGIHWAGVANTYSDNVVTEGPHNCFLGGGNEADANTSVAGVDCVFERNTLDTCAFEASDTGAFYVCGQQASAFVNRGNSITGSTFRNIRNVVGTGVQSAGVQAIYLDDQMSGWSITNNTFLNCQIGSFIGGGRRNVITGNYYEKCDTAQHFDNRGMNWQLKSDNCTEVCEPLSGCDCNTGAAKWMVTKAAAAKTWSSRWPYLGDIAHDSLALPAHNVLADNTYCNCGQYADASNASIYGWNSTSVNNVEVFTCADDGFVAGPANPYVGTKPYY